MLVAFAIAAFALVGLVRSTGVGLASAKVAAGTVEAVARAQSLLDQVGIATPIEAGETRGADGDGYDWRIALTPVAIRPRAAAPAAAGPSAAPVPALLALYSVEVMIGWRAQGRPQSVMLFGYRIAPARSAGDANG